METPPTTSPQTSAVSLSASPDQAGDGQGRAWCALAGLWAGLVGFYWETLARLPPLWQRDPDSAHGYLVPVVAIFFAWRRWSRLGLPVRPRVEPGECLAGWARIALGVGGHAVCVFREDFLCFDVLSLLLAGSGLLLVLGGRRACRDFAFPLWFLIFMAPLPVTCYRWLALGLQQLTSLVAAVGLNVSGVPVVQEGCQLYLPGQVLQVGAACSGLRGILGLLAASLAIGELVPPRRGFRGSLVLLSLLVAIAANTVRVVLTGLIVYYAGQEWGRGVWHSLEGLFTTSLAMLLLLGAAGLLLGLWPASAPGRETLNTSENTER